MKAITHLICKSKKGSSSIMVMLIMLVLVVFGVLALMSSYSDFKLSKKSAAWHAAYYELDAKGEEFVSKIDNKLRQSLKDTNNESNYKKMAISAVQQLAKAKEYKIKLESTREGLKIGTVIEDADGNKLGVILSTKGYSDYKSKLVPFENQKLYEVVEWRQLPKEFKYEGQNDLWNGEVTIP